MRSTAIAHGFGSALGLAFLAGGCTGNIASDGATAPGGSSRRDPANPDNPANPGDPSIPDDPANPDNPAQPNTDPPAINYAMVRLTNAQYLNTIHDLFPGVTFDAPSLPNQNKVDGFTNAATGQTPTSLLVEDYQLAGESIAKALTGNFNTLVTCRPTSTVDEDACAQKFINDFGKRAYRRPLSSLESTRFFSFYKSARATDDFPTSVSSLVQVFLQSPSFLYRLETGNGQQVSGLTSLTSYETAARLSYFLVNTMPDAQLMQAADQGALSDPSQVEAHARRLLSDPRARTAVASFNYEWLHLDKTENITKDTKAFPSFTSDLAQAFHDATAKFIEHAFWDSNSLAALLTDSHAYVNDQLAPIYGVAPVGSSAFSLVGLDSNQRAGLFTQAGMLAGLAGATNDSPVQRGLSVLNGFLCQSPPAPPAGVNTNPPEFDPNTPATTRQRLTKQHAVGSCAACHTLMDEIGFAFENYDAEGKWRTQDSGLPVDANVNISGTDDVDGTYAGAVPLVQRLAQSQRVAACVSYHWLRYALGLDMTQINVEAAASVATTFAKAGGSFSELLVAVTKSDYFRSLKTTN